MRNMRNRFLIFAILKTDYACYALRFFSLIMTEINLNNRELEMLLSNMVVLNIMIKTQENYYMHLKI